MRSLNTSLEKILAEMEKAGIYGGCLFSLRPKENNPEIGVDFEVRLNDVLNVVKGYEDRVFPILWIHPYEDKCIPATCSVFSANPM